MAARLFTILLAFAATAYSAPLERRTSATCNIDDVEFVTASAADACALIPPTFTVTWPVTILAQYEGVYVSLFQQQPNWTGSSSVAISLCEQIISQCGGTVGVAEQFGAEISTGGAFGGPGVIEITGYNIYP
ncbi:hypothetical protein MMC17_000241 [Xylographa soralifera]|nr:hypothetical protein [Xylographa soralifera]